MAIDKLKILWLRVGYLMAYFVWEINITFPSEAAIDMGPFNILFVYIPTLNFLSDPPPYFFYFESAWRVSKYDT